MSLRKTALFFLAASLIVVASSAWSQDVCQSVSTNLIVNCGFETGDLSGWTLSGNTGYTRVRGLANPPVSLQRELLRQTRSIGQRCLFEPGRLGKHRYLRVQAGSGKLGSRLDCVAACLVPQRRPRAVLRFVLARESRWRDQRFHGLVEWR